MKVQLHPEAEEELFEGAAWYEDREPGLGDRFFDEVARWFDVVAEAPAMWPRWPGSPVLSPPDPACGPRPISLLHRVPGLPGSDLDRCRRAREPSAVLLDASHVNGAG